MIAGSSGMMRRDIGCRGPGVDSAGGAASPRCLRIDPLRSEGGESRCYRGRTRSARAFACLPPFHGKGGANASEREAREGDGFYVRLASPRRYCGDPLPVEGGENLLLSQRPPFAPKGITHAARNTTCMVVPAAVSGDGMTALPD